MAANKTLCLQNLIHPQEPISLPDAEFATNSQVKGKQCRSRFDGFFRSHQIWIYTICKVAQILVQQGLGWFGCRPTMFYWSSTNEDFSMETDIKSSMIREVSLDSTLLSVDLFSKSSLCGLHMEIQQSLCWGDIKHASQKKLKRAFWKSKYSLAP